MLTLAHANVNGLMGKVDTINLYFQNRTLDVLFLCETWFSKDNKALPLNTLYSHVYTNEGVITGGRRSNGGLLCIVRPQIKNQVQIYYKCPKATYVIIRISGIFVCHCYFPPSMADADVMQTMQTLREKTDDSFILLGDINARVGGITGDLTTNRRGRLLLDFLADSDLRLVPSSNLVPTCYSAYGSGVPDLVIVGPDVGNI